MTKKGFIIIISVMAAAIARADISFETIRLNPTYIYGQGFGETYAEADRGALSDLISKIAVGLTNEVIDVTNVSNANGVINTENAINVVVNTYSQATLTNTKSLTVAESPQYSVVRYITQHELDKIFAQRQDKVFDLIRNATRAESKGKVDDALRYYYWSVSLLKSLQYPNSVRYESNGDSHLLITWIPEQIDRILSSLDVKVSSSSDRDLSLYFTYNGKAVPSLDFSFYNGNSWTPLNSVKDGMAIVELRPGFDPTTLKIRYEYEYLGEAMIDPEIQSVMKIFKNTYFRKSEVGISPNSSKAKAKDIGNDNLISLEVADISTYNKEIKSIVSGIETGNYNGLRKYFTDDGWDMITRLLQYGNAKLIGKPSWNLYNLYGNRVVCRGIKMSFSFPNNHKTFTEDVTFTFNNDRLIESVAFGLGSEAKRDIFEKGKDIWDEKSMLTIATFLENYKTAFALKRIDYIEDIFDDNAVIIVGTVVKKCDSNVFNNLETGFHTGKTVNYNRYNKAEYIKRLRKLFARTEFVNIHFSHNDIVKMGKGGETYGIQIEQDYYSSVYGDTGYLFLIVDINNPEQPIIKLRTWQPDRDPNINIEYNNTTLPRDHPDYGIYGPGLF